MEPVYLFCANLFWSCRVLEAGRHLQIPVQTFTRLADLEQAMTQSPPPSRVILDIDGLKGDDWEAVPRLRKLLPEDGFLWGVGSHVDLEAQEKAAALGCHQVWPRSEFTRRIEAILSGRE
ncbi:MAG: hypothetical protein HY760_08465 [Nitrospirae bacterium]|nr:hypothetical protein [Nitrospirota bacterium]